jgi:hypothetical protein
MIPGPMGFIRRRIFAVGLLTIVLQVGVPAAGVVGLCCQSEDHHAAPAHAICPMQHAPGEECPGHHAGPMHHAAPGEPIAAADEEDCRLTCDCSSHNTTLLDSPKALVSAEAIVVQSGESVRMTAAVRPAVIDFLSPPPLPPPRS